MKDSIRRFSNSLGSSRALKIITESSDIILAFFVVVIIMMIIIPVPPEVLDGLIGINLTVSFALLMVALYITKAVHLSVFPSILLITTLFRLGIEISATKQILLHANAGQVIFAFGNFVVGGNFIVGGIVFLIITIVQFIVVTKGAERVAEVAARFTLDAMPGKQMSIDADMRSGIIDANQARQLRLSLQKESQLYGAMDGAMKFVKGDVIAGIVIAVINIIGGLVIGVFTHNMSALQAARTYTLLSIGGGLVSQIPSLLISLTAGIVTTRVSSDREETNLGREISSQLLSHPKAIILAAIITFLMSLVSAFPTVLFLSLSAGLTGLGINSYFKQRKLQLAAAAGGRGGPAVLETGPGGATVIRGGGDDYALTLPVMLEVGSYIAELIRKDREGGKFIEDKIPKMRYALYQDLGVRFPGVHVRTEAPNLEAEDYCIYLNEVPLMRGKIVKDHLLTNETEENLRRYNIPYTQTKNLMNQTSHWVEKRYKDILEKAGIKYWETLDVMILHLSHFYRQYASEFIGIQEVRAILEFIEKSFPDLVKEVTRLVPLQRLTEIFKRLVQEQVSIKDLRTILESLSEYAQTEKDTVILTEYIRASLKRYISYKYSKGQSVLPVYLLDPEIEDIVRGGIKQTSAGSFIALDPDTGQLILHAVRNIVKPVPAGGTSPLIITALDVRRFVRKLIEGEFPDYAVVSYQEIVPEIRIQPLGRIQLS
ncbi:MAG: type III secretion system export apparatus subunit SctV [Verrucomicrobia bacterium]|nr:type III secretion system export apparatus subunit SctV [Verrucomicrobiota bacterium]